MCKLRERGRPRAFDKQTALQQALQVFAQRGYEGASLDELTTAMGINRPSLYAAFGNKETLFLQALEAYACPQDAQMRAQLFAETDTRTAFARLFETLAKLHAGQSECGQPMGGCLLTNSTILSCSEQQTMAEALKTRHDSHEQIFYERLEQGRAAGDLAADCDTLALARYFNCLLAGLAVLARAQQNPEALLAVARLAPLALDRNITKSQN